MSSFLNFCYFQVTSRVSRPVDLPPPSKKMNTSAPTPHSIPAKPSVPWANGAFTTPSPQENVPILEINKEDEEIEARPAGLGAYQQVREKKLRAFF